MYSLLIMKQDSSWNVSKLLCEAQMYLWELNVTSMSKAKYDVGVWSCISFVYIRYR